MSVVGLRCESMDLRVKQFKSVSILKQIKKIVADFCIFFQSITFLAVN